MSSPTTHRGVVQKDGAEIPEGGHYQSVLGPQGVFNIILYFNQFSGDSSAIYHGPWPWWRVLLFLLAQTLVKTGLPPRVRSVVVSAQIEVMQ